MRQIHDYFRGLEYLINYWFYEKPYGLDFSLRDLSQIQNSQQHGYAMTSDKAIKNIAQKIDFTDKLFLDIGSGKGRVLHQAFKLGAYRCEGIEFSKKLNKIAEKNFDILNLNEACKSNCIDAAEFDRYYEFDIFFLFNPFEDHLYEKVIDTLMSQCSFHKKQRSIICYGGANLDSIDKYTRARHTYKGICPHRYNSVNIFTID